MPTTPLSDEQWVRLGVLRQALHAAIPHEFALNLHHYEEDWWYGPEIVVGISVADGTDRAELDRQIDALFEEAKIPEYVAFAKREYQMSTAPWVRAYVFVPARTVPLLRAHLEDDDDDDEPEEEKN